MDGTPRFEVEVAQNKHLPPDGAEIHAALTVTGLGTGTRRVGVAQVIVIDTSGSMSEGTRLVDAQRATLAAIDALRDDALFAVVAGHTHAEMAYPAHRGLVRATREHRKAARRAVRENLTAGGRTSMAHWLDFVGDLLGKHRDAVRHAVLLTDGWNTQPDELPGAIDRAAGVFDCDARGIGADWSPDDLLRIASALSGRADAVRGADELVADFTAITEAVMGKSVAEVRVRVQPTSWARPLFLRQTHPTEAEPTALADGTAVTYPTGAWGDETRRFHLALAVDRGAMPLEQDRRAAGVQVEVLGEDGFTKASGSVAVEVRWTANLLLSSEVDPSVADFGRQRDLAAEVNAGWQAYATGDRDTAEAALGRAVALAADLEHTEMLERLEQLVVITGDPRDGRVRLREALDPGAILSVILSASHSGVIHPTGPRTPEPVDVVLPKRRCGNPGCQDPDLDPPPAATFCGGCAAPLIEEAS